LERVVEFRFLLAGIAKARTSVSTHVTATERAASLLRHLQDCFGPLILYQGGGCCSGNLPICARRGDIRVGSGDILLDVVEGTPPFYVGSEPNAQFRNVGILLDVEDGETGSLSIENREKQHFVSGSFYIPVSERTICDR
jgi:uncharacterized protein (DUF779 family)